MDILELNSIELDQIDNLIQKCIPNTDLDDGKKLKQLNILSHELPERLKYFLNDFKYNEEGSGVCLIKGYAVDDNRIGSTPPHWDFPEAAARTNRESIYLLLLSTLLGDAIGWNTQQNSKLIHDILPIKAHRFEQLGSGTEVKLWWHTEDAFHPFRGNTLGLFCLRNNENVATTFASIKSVELSRETKETLFSNYFMIKPDPSHLPETNEIPGYAEIRRMNEAPEKISVLFGDFLNPYLRIDPYFMHVDDNNDKAKKALDEIVAELEKYLDKVILAPGDCLFLDNDRVVHGRDSFKAKFNGTDRWLKRIILARDLRKSRTARFSDYSRIITS